MIFTFAKFQNQGRLDLLQGQEQGIVLGKVIIIDPWLLLSNLSTITQELSCALLRDTSQCVDDLEALKVNNELLNKIELL